MKLATFQDKNSNVCQKIFPEYARPAYKMEVSFSKLFYEINR
jgi:hypothetical protein